MNLPQQVHQAADATPTWANVVVIVGSAVASWVQPIAGVVAILWGLLQIYLAIEKRWFRK